MQAYLSFILVPAVIGGAYLVGPPLSKAITPRPESISVQQLTLPPAIREVKQTPANISNQAIRMDALIPANIMEQVAPPQIKQRDKPANERFLISSILLAPERSSAVINGEVHFIGDRFDGYRIRRITKDKVTFSGPHGVEKVSLGGFEVSPLFKPLKSGKDSLTVALPKQNTQTKVPPDELERQFRHLLENFGQ